MTQPTGAQRSCFSTSRRSAVSLRPFPPAPGRLRPCHVPSGSCAALRICARRRNRHLRPCAATSASGRYERAVSPALLCRVSRCIVRPTTPRPSGAAAAFSSPLRWQAEQPPARAGAQLPAGRRLLWGSGAAAPACPLRNRHRHRPGARAPASHWASSQESRRAQLSQAQGRVQHRLRLFTELRLCLDWRARPLQRLVEPPTRAGGANGEGGRMRARAHHAPPELASSLSALEMRRSRCAVPR